MAFATPAGDAVVRLGAPGRHNVSNALAAAAAALAVGIPLPAIVRGLEAFRPVAGRLAALRSGAGATVIDDTYNANPDSARAAIEVLAAARGARVLVLGDMGELGAEGAAMHAEVGEFARTTGVERLYTLGALSARASDAFGAGARHFERLDDLVAALRGACGPGTTVLVKGSRFMRMERVVDALVARGEERGAGACS
jgi:UDP-N-acetylmuramoyl-tripeptide--D-alanyl-D-alanine ligase